MSAYELPTSLNIGGVDFNIRTDYRAILDILIAMNDSQLEDWEKTMVMIQILYEDYESIQPEYFQEAAEKAVEFIDCGQQDDGKKNPKLVDWEQDARLIIPAVNKVAHMEIRSITYMHWWTFFAYFMEIGESLFSNIVSYRNNRAKHKKIEAWEREFYKDNKKLIDFKTDICERSDDEKAALAELWG